MTDWIGSLNGLAFGAGTNYGITGLSGWKDQSSSPLGGAVSLGGGGQTGRQRSNGSFRFPYWMPDRVVTLTLEVIGTAGTAFDAAIAALDAATQPAGNGASVMALTLDGITTQVTGAVTGRTPVTDLAYQADYAVVPITFECWDPCRYLATPQIASTVLPSSSGGLTVPFTVPFTIDAVQQSGQVSLTNSGNANGALTVTFSGSVTGPSITDQQTGNVLAFSPGFTVYDGDALVIDAVAGSALYNGQASRNADIITRGWPIYQPGLNTYGFAATTGGTNALMTVTGTDAWL